MRIIFYGAHSNDRMNVLNDTLKQYFTNFGVTEILNIYDIKNLLTIDMTSTIIILYDRITFVEYRCSYAIIRKY
jgi:hypothetical protein